MLESSYLLNNSEKAGKRRKAKRVSASHVAACQRAK